MFQGVGIGEGRVEGLGFRAQGLGEGKCCALSDFAHADASFKGKGLLKIGLQA